MKQEPQMKNVAYHVAMFVFLHGYLNRSTIAGKKALKLLCRLMLDSGSKAMLPNT